MMVLLILMPLLSFSGRLDTLPASTSCPFRLTSGTLVKRTDIPANFTVRSESRTHLQGYACGDLPRPYAFTTSQPSRPFRWPDEVVRSPRLRLAFVFGKVEPEKPGALTGIPSGRALDRKSFRKRYLAEVSSTEAGLLGLYDFLADLSPELRDVIIRRSTSSGLDIAGTWKDGGSAELFLYYGETDPASSEYRSFVRRELSEASLFYYIGHSAQGKNLSLRELGLSSQLKKSPYLMFAAIGCQSLRFFGEELRRERRGVVTDFLLSDNERYFRGSAGVLLESIARARAGQGHAITYPDEWAELGQLILDREGTLP